MKASTRFLYSISFSQQWYGSIKSGVRGEGGYVTRTTLSHERKQLVAIYWKKYNFTLTKLNASLPIQFNSSLQ